MANKSVESFMTELEEQFNTRRSFLSGIAGAIATGAALHLEPDKSSSLKEMASALHDAIGRYSDQNAPFHFENLTLDAGEHALEFAMECLRDCSVDEIQHVLKPLYGGAS